MYKLAGEKQGFPLVPISGQDTVSVIGPILLYLIYGAVIMMLDHSVNPTGAFFLFLEGKYGFECF